MAPGEASLQQAGCDPIRGVMARSGLGAIRRKRITIRNSARLQPLLQQLLQRRSNFRPPLLWDVIDQRLHRALDQHSQDCVRVCTARASHADRLGEDVGWIGSASSNTLGAPDQAIDCGKRTVWHGAGIVRPSGSGASSCSLPPPLGGQM